MIGLLGAGTFVFYDEVKALASSHFGIAAPGMQQASVADVPLRATSSGTVELKARDNGHYVTRADLNGRPVDVMVDTGATLVALTYDDARRAGVYLKDADFTLGVATANGTARVAPVTLDRVSIGNLTVRQVSAVVAEPGKLPVTLLGMSFLSRLQRVDMRGGTLLLQN